MKGNTDGRWCRKSWTPHRLANTAMKASLVGIVMIFVYIKSGADYQEKTIIIYDPSSRATSSQEMFRPFPMPIQGAEFSIFQPLYDMNASILGNKLWAPADQFIEHFRTRLEWLDTISINTADKGISLEERAKAAYLEMLKSQVSGIVYGAAEHNVAPKLKGKPNVNAFDVVKRSRGSDWTYLGDTMTGFARLENVKKLLTDVIVNNIPGDYIETGVWRGGSSIFARGLLHAYNQSNIRTSYVCDSFQGLPPGTRGMHSGDPGWHETVYLEVSEEIVANNFQKYSLLDSHVVFVKGFFNETMPPLSKHIGKLAVMRLDGDLYESTVDVLYTLYDKLEIGGYVIMDDWFKFPSKVACEDFFAVHGIQPQIIPIDAFSAYWKKTEHIKVQQWRYTQNKFKSTDVKA